MASGSSSRRSRTTGTARRRSTRPGRSSGTTAWACSGCRWATTTSSSRLPVRRAAAGRRRGLLRRVRLPPRAVAPGVQPRHPRRRAARRRHRPARFLLGQARPPSVQLCLRLRGYINGVLAGFEAIPTYLAPPVLGYDPDAPKYAQDLAEAERLFRGAGWWDRGFTASVLAEQNNDTMIGVGLVLKDSLESLNENFRINVVVVPEAQYDEGARDRPVQYPMWVKNGAVLRPRSGHAVLLPPGRGVGRGPGVPQRWTPTRSPRGSTKRGSPPTRPSARPCTRILPLLHEDPMWLWARASRTCRSSSAGSRTSSTTPLWVMPRWQFYSKG